MKRKLLYLFLLGIVPFIYSCEGPEGPAGPEGPQGVPGVAGTKGDPGDPAGAFQLSTDTISTNAAGDLSFSLTLTKDVVTSVENGVVLVYAKSSNLWFPLPGLVVFGNEISNFTFAYGIESLKLNMFLFQTDQTAKKRKFQKIRVVIVPAQNGRLNAEFDWKDYEAVRKEFNLPE